MGEVVVSVVLAVVVVVVELEVGVVDSILLSAEAEVFAAWDDEPVLLFLTSSGITLE